MNLTLYTNNSEKNKIGKNIAQVAQYVGTLREESSIINPVFLIQADTIGESNYLFCEEFNRYYFIVGIDSVRSNLWRVTCAVDVLESFKESILSNSVLVDASQNAGYSFYLPGDQWVKHVKTLTDIITFPNGLSQNGEFILITAGG